MMKIVKMAFQKKCALWLVPVGLCLAVTLVFGQTVAHEFIAYDDPVYVYSNPEVTEGLSLHGVAWAFTHVHSRNWHPLTWLSHMVDCSLFGLWAGGHHLTNVIFHSIVGVLLFLVLLRMTGGFWRSAFVAALFCLHPLRVESVAWVSERKDLLSGIFFMLTLWAYTRYVRFPFSWWRYVFLVVVFALGLMTKPMLVTVPFVLLLLDYWPLNRMGSEASVKITPFFQQGRSVTVALILEKTPLFALTALSIIVTIVAQGTAVQPLERYSVTDRLFNATISYVAYVKQYLFPVKFALLYPFPVDGISPLKFAAALFVLAAVTYMVFLLRRRAPYSLTGWLWYLGMLVPVIGLVQVGSQAMADRYTYLPQIGLAIVLAWGLGQLARTHRALYGCVLASLALLIGLAFLSWNETGYWYSTESIWRHATNNYPNNYAAHRQLAEVFLKQQRLDEAQTHFRRAIDLYPKYVPAHLNLGSVLASQGRLQDALNSFNEVLKINPKHATALLNVAGIKANFGEFDEAIALFKKIIEIDPASDDASDAKRGLSAVLKARSERNRG